MLCVTITIVKSCLSSEIRSSIASVEMVEAVGQRFWPDYVAAVERLTGRRTGIDENTLADVRVDAVHSATKAEAL